MELPAAASKATGRKRTAKRKPIKLEAAPPCTNSNEEDGDEDEDDDWGWEDTDTVRLILCHSLDNQKVCNKCETP